MAYGCPQCHAVVPDGMMHSCLDIRRTFTGQPSSEIDPATSPEKLAEITGDYVTGYQRLCPVVVGIGAGPDVSLPSSSSGPQIIGGLPVGTVGSGLYSGYVLAAGDDFQTLDLVSAANPTGKYFTTRTYQGAGGCRAPATGGLNIMHDASPDYTGWQDSNRGIPIATLANSHQIVPGEGTGALRLLAIRQSAGEQTLLNTGVSGQIERGAMISTAGAFWWQPPAIIEFRAALPAGPHGQHPDMWGLVANPPGGPNTTGDEYGFECGNTKVAAYHNDWAGGVLTGSETDINSYRDGLYHTFMVVISATDWKFYIDGSLQKTYNTTNPYTRGHLAAAMYITHHILNASYQSQTYVSSEWDLSVLPNGVVVDVEWMRIWRGASATHYVPQTTLPDVQVTAGGALNVVLPSQSTLWGATGLTEYVTCIQNEVEEPGSSNTTSYTQFPTGISYNSGTRTLSGTMPAQSGALYVAVGVSSDGATCVPARFRILAAPVYKGPAQFSWTKGTPVSQDVYTLWDTGRLFGAASNPKGLVVSGLPVGLSFDPSTGLITGTPTNSGTGTVVLSSTNSAGQTTTANVPQLTIDPALGTRAPTLTGNPVLIGSWDFDQTPSIASSGGSIDSILGVDGTVFTLSGPGGTNRPVLSTRAANGTKGIADFTAASSQRLSVASGLGIGTGGNAIVIIGEPKTAATAASVFEIQQDSATATVNRSALLNGTGTNGWGSRKCGATGGNQDANQGVAYATALTLAIGGNKAGNAGSTLNINGVGTPVTSAGATTNPVSVNLTTLGCRSVSSVLGNFWGGYVWRVLVYGQELTDTNREEIAVWAATNYGTTNNP